METKEQIALSNAEIVELLSAARGALRGQADFGPEQLRALQATLDRMQPLMLHSQQLRSEQPELRAELDIYRAQLAELQVALEQIRVMLLACRAQMFSERSQLEAVSHWAHALRQTRET